MYFDASVSTHDELFILHCCFCNSLIIRLHNFGSWDVLYNLGSGDSTTLEVEIYNLGSGDSTTLEVEIYNLESGEYYAILVIDD